MPAGIYIRKSRKEKDKESHRLTVQREQLPAYATAQGWQYEIYDDGHASAAKGKTEDLRERARLEGDIRASKINIILAIELSRLSRDDSLQDYVAWLHLCAEHGVKLATMSRILDPAQHSDWMLLLMEGGFSSVEMRVLQSRMKDGRDQALRSGKYLGGQLPAPYRYDAAIGRPVIDPEQLVRMQHLWKLAESQSTRTVAEEMGMPLIAVRRAITDDRLLFYQSLRIDPETGEQIPCEWEPCMPADQAARIRAGRKNRVSGYQRRHAAGLLTNLGVFVCGYCGRTIRAFCPKRPRKDGTRLEYYGCKGNEHKATCPSSRLIAQYLVDDRLVTNLTNTLDNTEQLRAYWLSAQENNNALDQVKSLNARAQTLQDQKKRLIAAIAEGVIDFADAKERRASIEAELASITKTISTANANRPDEPDWDALAITADEFWSLDMEAQRQIITATIRTIRFYSSYILVDFHFPRAADGSTSTRIHLPASQRGCRPGLLPVYKSPRQ